jgi:phosphatidate cytidylyltransferase
LEGLLQPELASCWKNTFIKRLEIKRSSKEWRLFIEMGQPLPADLINQTTLAPELSPKKTREGAVGAVLLSMMVSALFFSIIEITSTNFAYVLILGLSASIMAQIGDLMISAMKRYFGVKDSGKIIPGHGGVLDRFDSFLMVLPLVYYFFLYCV